MLSENALASEFGVSRTPIRQVLQRLEFDGLVTIRQGSGTLVTPLDLAYLQQVYELRLRLISLTVGLSSGPAAPEALAPLRQLLSATRQLDLARPQPRALSLLYTRFTTDLLRVIGNRPLRDITERFFYQTHRAWLQLLSQLDWAEEASCVAGEFSAVLAALESGDLHELAEVRRTHFEWCLRRMARHMPELDVAAIITGPAPPSRLADSSRYSPETSR